MAELDNAFTTKVEVSLARIEERQISTSTQISSIRESVDTQFKHFQREADHRHNNIKQQLETYVPRKEVEAMIEKTRLYAEVQAEDAKQHCDANRAIVVQRVETVAEKVDSISNLGSKIFWTAVSLAGTGVLGLITWFITAALAGKTL